MTMQVWDYSQSPTAMQEGYGTCCSSVDVEDARGVCQHLGIPFYMLNCTARFKTHVIDPFIQTYLKGEDPYPMPGLQTLILNFDYLIQKMSELECDYLATGHYAQVKKTPERGYSIYRSTDDWERSNLFSIHY